MYTIVNTSNAFYALGGGACATVVDEEGSKEIDLSSYEVGQEVIIVSDWLQDHLDQDDLLAIIAHEAGHLMCDHTSRAKAQGVDVSSDAMIDMPHFELEADAYAASIVGASRVIKALTNTMAAIENDAENIMRQSGKFDEYQIKMTLPHVGPSLKRAMAPRLKALWKLRA